MNNYFIYELIKEILLRLEKVLPTDMPAKDDKRYSAPALEKGLDILEFLANQAVPCSQTEIAESLERTPSEIYRMLSVLEQRGYVLKQAGTTSFSLSLKLFELGHLQSGISNLRKAIRYPMEQLANEIGEACHFSIQNGSDLIVMMERMPARRICLAVGEGTVLPLTKTASGLVQLTQFDDTELQSILAGDENYQSLSKAKQQDYQKRITLAREQGHVIANSQVSPGVVDVAVPIGITNTDLCGSLAVSQLSADIQDPKIQTNLKAMQACAATIHQNLGI